MSTLKSKTIARTGQIVHTPRAWAWTLTITILLLSFALIGSADRAMAQDEALAATAAQGWQGYEEQPLRVNIWHDQDDDDVYGKGESVRVHFETNHDAYAVIYRIDAAGEVSVLWPRSRYDDGFVFANHVYNLPSPGGRRVRTADMDGVEYVQSVVSAYPFDLRDLDIDFHHEAEEVPRSYYVAGDPFLAMNDINFEVTGLEDTEDFVVTNYTSWYVGRQVEHPRYLCSQCHTEDVDYHPYADSCTIEIHHNYGWTNDWYASYGYYPVYYNPVYYYVDPWTMRPWVNYWYRPWYSWPSHTYGWGFDCYVWNYSPYWHGDVWHNYNDGHRRYRPLGKGVRYKNVKDGADYRNPRGLVKTPRPSKDMKTAMETRARTSVRVKGADGKTVQTDRSDFRDVGRTKRTPQKLTKPVQDNRRGGIRVPADRTQRPATIGSGSVRSGSSGAVRSGTRGTSESTVKGSDRRSTTSPQQKVRSNTLRSRTTEPTRVRPVEPRSKGSRIWKGGSSNTKPVVKPKTQNRKPTAPTTSVKPTTKRRSSTPKSNTKSSVRSNKSSSSSSKGTTTRGSSRSSGSKSGSSKSSKSSGSSKSGGSSKRK